MAFRLSFGGKHQPDTYYQEVLAFIFKLKPVSTLRSLSDALNEAGFTTPTGLAWDKPRLANFIRVEKSPAKGLKHVQET